MLKLSQICANDLFEIQPWTFNNKLTIFFIFVYHFDTCTCITVSNSFMGVIAPYCSLRANPLAEAQDKYNWNRTSKNYVRICLNKIDIFFLNLAFRQVGVKN